MARAKSRHRHEDVQIDRPWVFFMIDCFLLVTEFFILTFKFKVEEPILPERNPPGVPPQRWVTLPSTKEVLDVDVRREGGSPVYTFRSQRTDLAGFRQRLTDLYSSNREFSVRVSCEASTPWEDVMAVFNECTRVRITECGLMMPRVRDE